MYGYDTTVEKYEHRGVSVQIHYDESESSPREWSNLSKLYCWDDRIEGAIEYGEHDAMFSQDDHETLSDAVAYLIEQGAVAIMPLFLLDHSGYSIRAGENLIELDENGRARACVSANRFIGDGAGWDTTMCGFAWTDQGRIDEIGTPDHLIIECIEDEIQTLNQFFTGDVYGYITDPDGEHEDSCWGFYGIEDAREEANIAADWVAEQRMKEQNEASYWAARDVPTI